MKAGQLLQEYGLDFRYMLDQVLVESPKEFAEARVSFFHEQNAVSTNDLGFSKESARRHPNTSSEDMVLPGPPTPPLLAAPPPPVTRRRPLASAVTLTASPPPPLPVSETLHLPQPTDPGNIEAHGDLYPSAPALRPGIAAQSPGSTYSGRLESAPANAPLFSHTNQPLYPPLSALRARTPVSTATQYEQSSLAPTSAPVTQANFASPLPRPPMSAIPFKMPDRSDSVRGKDSSVLENAKDNIMAYDRPMRSARASPALRMPGLPLRSANRPGSATGQRTPVAAVAQHEGMI